MSEFDEETEYLDAIYNVSKGSDKKKTYTKEEVAGAYLGAAGVAAGAGIASRGGMKVRDAKQELKRVPRNVPFDTTKQRSIRYPGWRPSSAADQTNRIISRKQVLRSSIRGGNKLKVAGVGLAGLGGAGLVASEASAYNRNKVSKGSTKNNSVGPYTKTDVAAQLGAATGIGTGVGIARLGNKQAKYVNHQKTKLDNFLAGKDPKNFSPVTRAVVSGAQGDIKYLARASSRTKAAGLGLAGLGAAGMLASDASAYKRNKGKNMKVSKSAYNMLPKGFSAARKAKALEMAPDKFSAKKQAAYNRMGLSVTQGDIADIAGAGVVGAGIGASLPPMYRKRDKMAASRKAKKVSKAFTLTGEKGDRRNSQYAAGSYLGAAGGASAGARLGARSAGTRYGVETQRTADNIWRAVDNTQAGRKIDSGMEPIKGLKAITRGKGAGAVAGTAIGLGAVGAARKMRRNKMAPVSKSAFGVEHTDISKGLPSNLKNSLKGADKIAAQRTAATGNREKGKKAGMKALKSDYPSLVNSRVKGKMFSTKKNVTANTTVAGAAGRNMYSDKSGLTNYGPTRGRYKGENAKLNGSRQGDYLLTRAGANAEGRRRRMYSPIGADLKEISNANLARLKPAARNRPLRNI